MIYFGQRRILEYVYDSIIALSITVDRLHCYTSMLTLLAAMFYNLKNLAASLVM